MLVYCLSLVILLGGYVKERIQTHLAVTELERSGVRVLYDWQPWSFPDSDLARVRHKSPFAGKEIWFPECYADRSPVPAGVRHLMGETFFHRVTMVVVADAEIPLLRAQAEEIQTLRHASEEDMRHIASFRHLRGISCASDTLSGEWLKHLRGCKDLRLVRLALPRITDAQLSHLATMTSVERVYLLGAHKITDKGLASLRNLPNLKVLCITRSQVQGNGLRDFKSATSLQKLWLSGSSVNDEGCRYIAQMTNLRSIDLSRTCISDAGIRILTPLRNLQSISLCGTPITDEALHLLGEFRELRRLNVMFSNVTPQGVAAFRRTRSALQVSE